MARGYHAAADIVTQTRDGVSVNDLWDAYQEALLAWNSKRTALVELFTFPIFDASEDTFPNAAGTADFEEATEFGVPVAHRPEATSDVAGYTFKWFDLSARFTWRYLADAPSRQVDQVANMALEADNRLVFLGMMRTLFGNTRRTNKEGITVYPFYSGVVGDKPKDYGSTVFADQHNHFTTTGGATLDANDLEALINNVTEHGYTRLLGYSVVVFVNKAQGDRIRIFRSAANNGGVSDATHGLYDFVPSSSTPSFLLPLDARLPEGFRQPPNTYQGFDVIGAYGDALIVQEDYIPAGYLVCLATGGSESLSNPIGLREHPTQSLRGLRLVKGKEPDYPLIDSYYVRGFGTGVRNRGAGAVMQVTASPTYSVPAQYAA